MMAAEIELAELECNWMRHKAEKAADATSGVLDPAVVDEVRRLRGWGMAEAYAALKAALADTYEGTAEGGRALLAAPGLKHLRSEQKGIILGVAGVELAGPMRRTLAILEASGGSVSAEGRSPVGPRPFSLRRA